MSLPVFHRDIIRYNVFSIVFNVIRKCWSSIVVILDMEVEQIIRQIRTDTYRHVEIR